MLIYEELSNNIIKAYYNVLKILGKGLAEKVYENALCIEFDEMNIAYERQKSLPVSYKGHPVGDYIADIFVEGKIIIEMKAVPAIVPEHLAQALNYVNLTHSKIGYILNFGQKEGRGFRRLLGIAAQEDEE